MTTPAHPKMSSRPAMTPSRYRKMIAERMRGLYHSEETRDEAILSVRAMRADEVAVTLYRQRGVFCAYTLRDMMTEVARWRELGLKCLECNLRERDLGGVTVWSIVIQPKELKPDDPASGLCPLSLGLGTMVSGFTYLCKTKSLAETVVRALN